MIWVSREWRWLEGTAGVWTYGRSRGWSGGPARGGRRLGRGGTGWEGGLVGGKEKGRREAYAVRVVLYPHGVFERVGGELAGDGWHDVGGGDVSEARTQAERVFWVGGDQRGVDCLAWQNEGAVGRHGGRVCGLLLVGAGAGGS